MGCDSFALLADRTADGSVIFAKNSDRDRNEAQVLEIIPHSTHTAPMVMCTHIAISQVRETFTVCLSRPVDMWGAEMGCNEHGVCIGNEALFCQYPASLAPGLIGMDIVRLALERASSAAAAVRIIGDILEAHGQSGRHAAPGRTPDAYHNAFLIVDAKEIWHMESVGSSWVAQQITQGARAISNYQQIKDGEETLRSAVSLPRHEDALLTAVGCGRPRQQRVLARVLPRCTLTDVFAILRDHGVRSCSVTGYLGCDVCAHAGALPARVSQTTASLMVHIRDGLPTLWATGTSAPCLSIFKPFWLTCSSDLFGPPPGPFWDKDSLWWRHEQAHRRHLEGLAAAALAIAPARDAMEQQFVGLARTVRAARDCAAVAAVCWEQAREIEGALAELPCGRGEGAASTVMEDGESAVPLHYRPLLALLRVAPLSGLVFRVTWALADARAGIPGGRTRLRPYVVAAALVALVLLMLLVLVL